MQMVGNMATLDHTSNINGESRFSSSSSSESLEPRTMTSEDSTSTCSTSSSESKLERFNRMLRFGWKLFRKESMRDRTRERSKSDVGFYCGTSLEKAEVGIPSEVLVRRSLQLGLPLSLQIIDDEARELALSRCYLASNIVPAATGPSVVVDARSSHSDADCADGGAGADSDCDRRGARVKRQAPPPPVPPHAADESLLSVSSSNFSGAGGFPGPVARSAPATPLQAEATHPPPPRTPVHSFAKCDKGAVKQLSSSAPSVSADVAGVGAGGVGAGTAPVGAGSDAGSGDKSPRAPGKARQKKFLRHFPQVGPDERVLNYYSCALVGDILLQGHLYITKNYFAFYSNVFGYVTKLLIPIASVLRVSKEKLARIIPNAVGVATADERHVFGSLLSRDTTYKYMLKVWKEATAAPLLRDTRVQPAKELRVSEAELEASEYSQDDDSSCSGSGGDGVGRGARVMAGGVVGAANLRHRTAATPARRLGDDTGVLKQPPVIQPALLLKSPTPNGRGAWGARAARTTGRTRACVATLAAVALLLTMSAALLLYRIHQHHIQHNFNGLGAGVSGNTVYGELLRWQGELRTHSATQVHRFLAHNLQQLTKVRQSLEALSSMMITDTGGNKQSFTSGNSESTEVLMGS